jgi:hypothetical protein
MGRFIWTAMAAMGFMLFNPTAVGAADGGGTGGRPYILYPGGGQGGTPALEANQLYLVFDPRLNGRGEHCELVLHPFRRHPLNPVIQPEFPWEAIQKNEAGMFNKGRIQVNSVMWDEQEQIFKMWYFGYTGDCYCCYATSKDGVHWDKPKLGLHDYEGSKDNNIWGVNLSCQVARNEADSDPTRRYVSWGLQNRPTEDGHGADNSLYRFLSPDGLHWTRDSDKALFPGAPAKYLGGTAGDGAHVYYFDRLKKYICLYYVWIPNPNEAPFDQTKNKMALRSTARFESPDGVTWDTENPTWAFKRDERDASADPYMQYYGSGPLVHAVGDLYLGLTDIFHSNDGTLEIGFSFSTDTVTWHRPFPGRYVLPLTPPGEWDSGVMYSSLRLVEKDGLWWMYYSGCPYRHRTAEEFPCEGKRYIAVGLAQMPIGRIVSARCWDRQGSWTVGPVKLSGAQLLLNAAILDHINVTLLNEKGEPIPGYTAMKMRGNGLEIPIKWDGGGDLSALRDKPVKIKFEMNDAEIFGFRCR